MVKANLTFRELHDAVGGGEFSCADGALPDDLRLDRVVTDSRAARRGDVFWALRGRHNDGAEFASDAFERGAVGVVSGPRQVTPPPGHWALRVGDAHDALRRLARHRRRSFTGQVVAVTGSAGKTTTRMMIDTILARSMRGACSPRNYNNHIGLPLSLLGMDPADAYGVFELGASAAGEIAGLARLCEPQIGVVTSIGDAHLGGFGSRQCILESKLELLAHLPRGGLAIVNGDDQRLVEHAREMAPRVVTVGRNSECDLCATEISAKAGWMSFCLDGARFGVPLFGRHHLNSALLAIAVSRNLGVPDRESVRALARFAGPPMRCRLTRRGAMTVVDDTYNSNPSAVAAAFDLLRDSGTARRKVIVTGDMLELGAASEEAHRTLGRQVVTRAGADLLIACGEMSEVVVAAARNSGMPSSTSVGFRRVEDCAGPLSSMLAGGDTVLVKGSRALRMERLVDAILDRREDRASESSKVGARKKRETRDTTSNDIAGAPSTVLGLRERNTAHPPG